MPLAPSEFSHRPDVAVPLPQGGGGPRAQLCVTPGWDEDPHRSPLAVLMSSLVDRFRVVCAVRRNTGERLTDLLEQGRDLGSVMCPPGGETGREDLTGICIEGGTRDSLASSA